MNIFVTTTMLLATLISSFTLAENSSGWQEHQGHQPVCDVHQNAISTLGPYNYYPHNLEVETLGSSYIINEGKFWNFSVSSYLWECLNDLNSHLYCAPTSHYLAYSSLISNKPYKSFYFSLQTKCSVTKPYPDYSRLPYPTLETLLYARGYSFQYYQSKERNLEFRVFPDVKQISVYIRDDQGSVEHKKKLNLNLINVANHEIFVHNGMFRWSINGQLMFEGETTLQVGYLRLTNHNNGTEFHFNSTDR